MITGDEELAQGRGAMGVWVGRWVVGEGVIILQSKTSHAFEVSSDLCYRYPVVSILKCTATSLATLSVNYVTYCSYCSTDNMTLNLQAEPFCTHITSTAARSATALIAIWQIMDIL